jgi:hypothetical protein
MWKSDNRFARLYAGRQDLKFVRNKENSFAARYLCLKNASVRHVIKYLRL